MSYSYKILQWNKLSQERSKKTNSFIISKFYSFLCCLEKRKYVYMYIYIKSMYIYIYVYIHKII